MRSFPFIFISLDIPTPYFPDFHPNSLHSHTYSPYSHSIPHILLIPHISTPIARIPTPIPRIPTLIPRLPTLNPRILPWFPAFPSFPFPIPAFTGSPWSEVYFPMHAQNSIYL